MLENAGISKGTITKSDRYLAVRLTKEFDALLDHMALQNKQVLDESEIFNLFYGLNLFKSTDDQNSDFIVTENFAIF